jgi:FkbM family methyltransferase
MRHQELEGLVLEGTPARFRASAEAQPVIVGLLQTWADYLSRTGAETPAVPASADLHAHVMRFIDSVAALREPHPAAEKCAEHLEYLTGKCVEFEAPLAGWRNGISLPARPRPEALEVLGRVVAEMIEHLLNLMRESPARPASPSPIKLAGSTDDSRKPRGYFYYGNELAMVETHFDTHLLLDLQDLSITPTIVKTGWWEPWIDILLRSLLQPGMTYVNAGANVGYHTVLGAKLVESYGKVFSFEANPHTYSLLKRTVYFNGFSERTALYPAAVWDKAGDTRFRYTRRILGGGGVSHAGPGKGAIDRGGKHPLREMFFDDPDETHFIKVPTVTLDETVGSEAEAIDLLHMDIEGSEGPALLGAQDILRRSPALRLILEWSYNSVSDVKTKEKFRKAAELLAADRYSFYVIEPPQGVNIYKTSPNLRRVAAEDLAGLGHCDLFVTR